MNKDGSIWVHIDTKGTSVSHDNVNEIGDAIIDISNLSAINVKYDQCYEENHNGLFNKNATDKPPVDAIELNIVSVNGSGKTVITTLMKLKMYPNDINNIDRYNESVSNIMKAFNVAAKNLFEVIVTARYTDAITVINIPYVVNPNISSIFSDIESLEGITPKTMLANVFGISIDNL